MVKEWCEWCRHYHENPCNVVHNILLPKRHSDFELKASVIPLMVVHPDLAKHHTEFELPPPRKENWQEVLTEGPYDTLQLTPGESYAGTSTQERRLEEQVEEEVFHTLWGKVYCV